jgi:hypothetical protein
MFVGWNIRVAGQRRRGAGNVLFGRFQRALVALQCQIGIIERRLSNGAEVGQIR